ncbi:hypothetical protein S1OALGB6SA_2137 [Olavius algarvensis spirochete endosymbiont]|nr:hypothetical protein S1OALGB6SA_2137 [Olavius algarvensis spirochete endosymbiont]
MESDFNKSAKCKIPELFPEKQERFAAIKHTLLTAFK